MCICVGMGWSREGWREKKFHHEEMFDGVGRSMNASLIIFISGCVFRMLVIDVLVVE